MMYEYTYVSYPQGFEGKHTQAKRTTEQPKRLIPVIPAHGF